MNYTIDVYRANQDDSCRFVLGKKGNNPLFVIGLNPSTANKEKSDRTLSKVMRYAEKNGFDGFIMLNLYPLRSTDPEALPSDYDRELLKENIDYIIEVLQSVTQANLLAGWGETIRSRKYFKDCLSAIYKSLKYLNVNWLRLDPLTKSGHPRHLSRGTYYEFSPFDVENIYKN